MSNSFHIQPVGRFSGSSQPVKRPKEFTCFSYDSEHQYRQDDSSLRYYYTPQLGADLSKGFDSFIKHDDSEDEHLVSLLRAIQHHEQGTGQRIDSRIVTWRGMMTKILCAPFETRDGFEMNATLYQDCVFIEENHSCKMATRNGPHSSKPRRGPPLEVMTFWGYKFETLATLPAPWGDTSREYIENRENEIVNNKEQYCSVVRTGIGNTVVCIGGEVDAIWDSNPKDGSPINWIELKTSQEIYSDSDVEFFHGKLMRFWAQSFLLGVPKIIVGFRTRDGILARIDEIETARIPDTVARGPRPKWNANVCLNFAASFLDWLREVIDDEGVWRISRKAGCGTIEVSRVEEVGHGEILTDDFLNWRIKLGLSNH